LDIYTLGVHGESQVVAWSAATIGGVCIDKSKHPADDIDHYELERSCKDRSQSIIRAKGSIPFGISSIVLSICDSILHDKRNVLPISCFQPEHGCCFSWPVVLGRSGVVRKVEIPLDDKEEAELAQTTKIFQEMVDRILPVDMCSNV
jgi:L-lactate dehydrogenase